MRSAGDRCECADEGAPAAEAAGAAILLCSERLRAHAAGDGVFRGYRREQESLRKSNAEVRLRVDSGDDRDNVGPADDRAVCAVDEYRDDDDTVARSFRRCA